MTLWLSRGEQQRLLPQAVRAPGQHGPSRARGLQYITEAPKPMCRSYHVFLLMRVASYTSPTSP